MGNLDGAKVGTTPLGNTVTVPVGSHVITLQHPKFSSKVIQVVVVAGEETSLKYDFRSGISDIKQIETPP